MVAETVEFIAHYRTKLLRGYIRSLLPRALACALPWAAAVSNQLSCRLRTQIRKCGRQNLFLSLQPTTESGRYLLPRVPFKRDRRFHRSFRAVSAALEQVFFLTAARSRGCCGLRGTSQAQGGPIGEDPKTRHGMLGSSVRDLLLVPHASHITSMSTTLQSFYQALCRTPCRDRLVLPEPGAVVRGELS